MAVAMNAMPASRGSRASVIGHCRRRRSWTSSAAIASCGARTCRPRSAPDRAASLRCRRTQPQRDSEDPAHRRSLCRTRPSSVAARCAAAGEAPATCAQQAGPGTAHCRWSIAFQGRCGGAARRSAEEPPPTPVCVCNGCETDADCTARRGGRCESFGSVCHPQANACTYPGDLCANAGQKCSRLEYTRPGNRRMPPEGVAHGSGAYDSASAPRMIPDGFFARATA